MVKKKTNTRKFKKNVWNSDEMVRYRTRMSKEGLERDLRIDKVDKKFTKAKKDKMKKQISKDKKTIAKIDKKWKK